jgi:hypothetical protein
MTSIVDTAKAARAALKQAFPGNKISVTSSHDITVRWTDDGPTIEQIQDALLAASCAVADTTWRGDRCLKFPDGLWGSYYLDRYNAAARAAEVQEWERLREESRAKEQRVNIAMAAARAAKAHEQAPPHMPKPAAADPAVVERFEALRPRAERDIAVRSSEDQQRRPSWAPPLILGERLAEICLELEYLTLDDKWIGRLWANFATPKRTSRWLREHTSTLPLHGIACRGFELYAGGTRGTRMTLLFEAQRTETGDWQLGPREYPAAYRSPREHQWSRLIREREQLQYERETWHGSYSEERRRQIEISLAELQRQIDAIDAEDRAAATTYYDRKNLRQEALELTRSRVLDFIGAPDAQMQLAGRLWGHCCICGKELSDPVSLERGIGPECIKHKIEFIHQLAADGCKLEAITLMTGMPADFVTEVLKEAQRG